MLLVRDDVQNSNVYGKDQAAQVETALYLHPVASQLQHEKKC